MFHNKGTKVSEAYTKEFATYSLNDELTVVRFEYGHDRLGRYYVKATEDGSEADLVYLYVREGDVIVGTIQSPGYDIATIKSMAQIYLRCVELMEAIPQVTAIEPMKSVIELMKFFPGKDYPYDGPALTLSPRFVIDTNADNSKEFINESGWKIKGEIVEDAWVDNFEAIHPVYGILRGDFERCIEAQSKEAFDHFWEHHEPDSWYYGDI